MNALSYFAPSFYLFTVHIAMDAFRQDVLIMLLTDIIPDPYHSEFYNAFVYTMDFIYTILLMSIIFLSLHMNNKDENFIPYIYLVSTIYGVFMLVVMGVLLTDLIRGLISPQNCKLCLI
jgi:hypothetical protein